MIQKIWLSWIILSVLVVWVVLGCGEQPPITSDYELIILSEGTVISEPVLEPGHGDASTTGSEQQTLEPTESEEDTNEIPHSIPEPVGEDASWGQEDEPQSLDEMVKSEPTPLPESAPEKPTTAETQVGTQWIGESCVRDEDCGYTGGRCLRETTGYPKGHCTQDCTTTCPDRTGKPPTFCISDAKNQGYCVAQCEQVACRAGYVCETRSRYNDTTRERKVCVPPNTQPPTKSLTVLMIGDSQSSGTSFAKGLVDFFRNPGKSCATAQTKNNGVYSYARVSAAARHWSDVSGSNKDWFCQNSTVYVNGTAAQNTTGSQLCSGITNVSKSVFQKLIDTHKPNTFLIQLGSNSIGFSESYVKGKIKQMLDQMPNNSLCFWVTPTFSSSRYLAAKRDIEAWTKEVTQGYTRISCHVITSISEMSQQTTCSSFYGSDGLHLTTCGSQLWGQLAAQKICNQKSL